MRTPVEALHLSPGNAASAWKKRCLSLAGTRCSTGTSSHANLALGFFLFERSRMKWGKDWGGAG